MGARRRGFAAVAAVAILTTGCSSARLEESLGAGQKAALTAPSASTGEPVGGAMGAPVAQGRPTFPTAGECPAGWTRLALRPETIDELLSHQSVRACSLGSLQTSITNGSRVPWVVDVPDQSFPWWQVTTIDSRSFRSVMPTGAFLLGRLRLTVAPGDEVRMWAAPFTVSMWVDPATSVAWTRHVELNEAIADMVDTWGEAALADSSTRGAAVATCTLSALSIAYSLGNQQGPITQQKAADLWSGTLEVGTEGRECWKAMKKVRAANSADDLATRMSARSAQPTFMDDLWRILRSLARPARAVVS